MAIGIDKELQVVPVSPSWGTQPDGAMGLIFWER